MIDRILKEYDQSEMFEPEDDDDTQTEEQQQTVIKVNNDQGGGGSSGRNKLNFTVISPPNRRLCEQRASSCARS